MRDIDIQLWVDELTHFRSNHCFNLASSETPTIVGTRTLQLTHDLVLERSDVITQWEENLEDRRLIKHALALYSDVEAARDQLIDVADRAMR